MLNWMYFNYVLLAANFIQSRLYCTRCIHFISSCSWYRLTNSISCYLFLRITPCWLPLTGSTRNFQTIEKWCGCLLLARAGSMTTLRVELMKVTLSHQYLQMAQWAGTATSDRLCPRYPCGLVHSALIEHAPLHSTGKWERKQGALAKSHHPAAVVVPGSFSLLHPLPLLWPTWERREAIQKTCTNQTNLSANAFALWNYTFLVMVWI